LNGLNGEYTGDDDLVIIPAVIIITIMLYVVGVTIQRLKEIMKHLLSYLILNFLVFFVLFQSVRNRNCRSFSLTSILTCLALIFYFVEFLIIHEIIVIFNMLFQVVSQLNGNNGECTNTDDMDHEERKRMRREARNHTFSGGHRGGNEFGPPVGYIAPEMDPNDVPDDASTLSSTTSTTSVEQPELINVVLFIRGSGLNPEFMAVRSMLIFLRLLEVLLAFFKYPEAVEVLRNIRKALLELRLTIDVDVSNEFDLKIPWTPLYDTEQIMGFNITYMSPIANLGYNFFSKQVMHGKLYRRLQKKFVGSNPSTFLFSNCMQELSDCPVPEAIIASHCFVNTVELLSDYKKCIGVVDASFNLPSK
jgi:hypothetical protein